MVAGMLMVTLVPLRGLHSGGQGPALRVSPGAAVCEVAAIGERRRVAWYLRRLAERPANVWFVVKSTFS